MFWKHNNISASVKTSLLNGFAHFPFQGFQAYSILYFLTSIQPQCYCFFQKKVFIFHPDYISGNMSHCVALLYPNALDGSTAA